MPPSDNSITVINNNNNNNNNIKVLWNQTIHREIEVKAIRPDVIVMALGVVSLCAPISLFQEKTTPPNQPLSKSMLHVPQVLGTLQQARISFPGRESSYDCSGVQP